MSSRGFVGPREVGIYGVPCVRLSSSGMPQSFVDVGRHRGFDNSLGDYYTCEDSADVSGLTRGPVHVFDSWQDVSLLTACWFMLIL